MSTPSLNKISAIIKTTPGMLPLCGDNPTLKFEIDGVGDWYLNCSSGDLSLTGKESAKIKISEQNLESLLDGSLNPQYAFLSGKLKASGDEEFLLGLYRLFSARD